MTFGGAFFIFSGLLSVTVQPTSSIISERENRCPSHGDICFPYDAKSCCGQHLECKQSKSTNYRYECLCGIDYEWIGNRCIKIPDKLCINNEDCKSRKNTECSDDNRCECKPNFVKTDFSTCKPLIGAGCKKNSDCFPDNSVCFAGQCRCADGFVSLSNKHCSPTFFELSCHSDGEECQDAEFFSCHQGRCFCPLNHVIVNDTTCIPLLNVACTEEKTCAVDNSECVNHKCQCKAKYVMHSDTRCKPTHLYDKCTNYDDCKNIKNAKCSKYNDCVCKKNFFSLNETTCAPIIGGPCEKITDCLIDNSICIDGQCQCKPYFKNRFNERCEPVLNKPCATSYDCINSPFAECSSYNACVCQQYYVASNDGSCLPLVIGICEKNSDCVTKNSYCHYNRCQCKKKYFPQLTNGRYECTESHLGYSCKKNDDCIIVENSECSDDKICVCRDKFYATDSGFSCSPGIGGTCSTDKDCLFNNSQCFENTCQCKPGYVSVSNNQCTLKSSAVSCNSAMDCGERWHSECSLDHTCYCKSNNTQLNDATCLPLIGGICWRDDQCVAKNSVCIDFHCRCSQPDFKAVAVNMCI